MEVENKNIAYYPTQNEDKSWIVVGQKSSEPPFIAYEGSFKTKEEAEVMANNFRIGNTEHKMKKSEPITYDEVKREILKERGYTERDFATGVVPLKEASEIMSLANETYKNKSALKFKSGGGVDEFTSIPDVLRNFIPMHQQLTISENIASFQNEIKDLLKAVNELPSTYGTENISTNEKIARLHYFSSSSDWYIVEKDTSDEQIQAFGLVELNGGYPELGYISIKEMLGINKIELDLHFEPKKLGVIKGEEQEAESKKEDDKSNTDEITNYDENVLDFVSRLDTSKLPEKAQNGISELIEVLKKEDIVGNGNQHYINFRSIIEEKYPEAIIEEDLEPTDDELKQLINGLKTQIKYAETPEEKKELEQISRGLSAMLG